jgi:hypothetical protein
MTKGPLAHVAVPRPDRIGFSASMALQELRDGKRDEILLLAAHRGARKVKVFGSENVLAEAVPL